MPNRVPVTQSEIVVTLQCLGQDGLKHTIVEVAPRDVFDEMLDTGYSGMVRSLMEGMYRSLKEHDGGPSVR
jgi:hypothetical protein